MKTKIKKLLNLIKKNNGRGVAAFFKKEKDLSKLDDIVKIKLPHNFEYSFHGTKIEKEKDKEKSFILRGFYYESDTNDGAIKIKISLTEPSKIFDKMSENEWKVRCLIMDKDSIGIIADDINGNLISLVETNKIKKIKEKKLKQLLPEDKNPDHSEEFPHCPMADINKPKLNLMKIKSIIESQEKEAKDNLVIKPLRKAPVRRAVAKNTQKENPN
jgi:regulator of replication initiation timing